MHCSVNTPGCSTGPQLVRVFTESEHTWKQGRMVTRFLGVQCIWLSSQCLISGVMACTPLREPEVDRKSCIRLGGS